MHRLLVRRGASPWAALAYGAWGGLGLALLHDTAEPLTYLAALLGIWWLDRNRTLLASGAFLASLLGRDTALLLSGPYLLAAGRDKRGAARWLPAALVVGLWLAWLGTVTLWVGGANRRPDSLRLPFLGFRATRSLDLPFSIVYLLVPAVLVIGYAARQLAREPRRPELWAAPANGLLVLSLGEGPAGLLWHSARVSTGLVASTLLALPPGPTTPFLGRGLAVLYPTSAGWTIAAVVRYLLWGAIALG